MEKPLRQSNIGNETQNMSAFLAGAVGFFLGALVTLLVLIYFSEYPIKDTPKVDGGIALPYLPPSE